MDQHIVMNHFIYSTQNSSGTEGANGEMPSVNADYPVDHLQVVCVQSRASLLIVCRYRGLWGPWMWSTHH
jgi:hypothetical protein